LIREYIGGFNSLVHRNLRVGEGDKNLLR
jgi:hypothetical protein